MMRDPIRTAATGPYVQSERMKTGIYMKYAKELIDKGEGIVIASVIRRDWLP